VLNQVGELAGRFKVNFISRDIGMSKTNGTSKLGVQSGDEKANVGVVRLVGLKLLTLITIITFLWSGIAINLLQLANYLTLRRLNFQLFTRVNYYLMYSAWAQVVTLFDWFFESKFKVYHAKKEDEDRMFSGHSIFLANHGYELDWVGAWLVTDKLGQLASCKAMLKSDLKYIPVVGWSWALSDQLFLDRNWEKDKHKFGSSVDTLLKYKPMVATFFCEGTRFTKDKFAESQKFAAERGLEAPKYHLIPRTKGFVTVMRHIKQRQRENPDLKVWIYNAQVAYEERGANNIADIIKRGLKPLGHLYFERISSDDVPDNDEECAKWLHELYLKKDTLQEYFNKNNSFPGHLDRRFVNYKPRLSTIANWTFWTLYTFLPLVYLVANLYARYGTFLVSLIMSTCFMLSYMYLSWIMYQADVGEEKCANKKAV